MALADDFLGLFQSQQAQAALNDLSPTGHVRLPTFSLTTTSLRHVKEWLRRLEDIDNRRFREHGNYVADPASIGLVDSTSDLPSLSAAGRQFLAVKAQVNGNAARGEYELLKILYYSGIQHPERVADNLARKHEHLLRTLGEFGPCEAHDEFLSRPSLLVVAEYLASFPGAIARLCRWSRDELVDLSELTEDEFEALGDGRSPQFQRLCKKVAGEFRRAEDRRLHHVISALLLDMQTRIVGYDQPIVAIPPQFKQLVQVADLAFRAEDYTEDVDIWYDNQDLRIARRLDIRVAEAGLTLDQVIGAAIAAQTQPPAGRGVQTARSQARSRRRAATANARITIMDDTLSERAEDFVEKELLRPEYGDALVRAGHRDGEVFALPDGLVPGADFYVLDGADEPQAFFEVKAFSGTLPADISVTRAECARALKCHEENIPYTLILVCLRTLTVRKVDDFGTELAGMGISHLSQFTVRIEATAA